MRSRPSPRRARPRRTAAVIVAAVVTVLALIAVSPNAAAGGGARASELPLSAPDAASPEWSWPLASFRLERPFVAPAHAYGPGHRGIDLRPVDVVDVQAPAAGVVAFSGRVAGRGILTIDHGDGLVTTLEPVISDLAPGTIVAIATPVGSIGTGGHTAPGSLHFGVRLDGEYINPMLLLGEVPRAVLLPCC